MINRKTDQLEDSDPAVQTRMPSLTCLQHSIPTSSSPAGQAIRRRTDNIAKSIGSSRTDWNPRESGTYYNRSSPSVFWLWSRPGSSRLELISTLCYWVWVDRLTRIRFERIPDKLFSVFLDVLYQHRGHFLLEVSQTISRNIQEVLNGENINLKYRFKYADTTSLLLEPIDSERFIYLYKTSSNRALSLSHWDNSLWGLEFRRSDAHNKLKERIIAKAVNYYFYYTKNRELEQKLKYYINTA